MEIVCVHCGATAMSKCPACRSIFMHEEYLSLIRSQISFEETKREEGSYKSPELIIKIDKYDSETAEDTLKRFFELGRDILNEAYEPDEEKPEPAPGAYVSKRSYKLPTVKKILCDHQWAPADKDQHSSIGCGHY